MRFMCYVDGSGERNLGFLGSAGHPGKPKFLRVAVVITHRLYNPGLGPVGQGQFIQGTHLHKGTSKNFHSGTHRHVIHRFLDRSLCYIISLSSIEHYVLF